MRTLRFRVFSILKLIRENLRCGELWTKVLLSRQPVFLILRQVGKKFNIDASSHPADLFPCCVCNPSLV